MIIVVVQKDRNIKKQKCKQQINKILTYNGRKYENKNDDTKDQYEEYKVNKLKTQNDIIQVDVDRVNTQQNDQNYVR